MSRFNRKNTKLFSKSTEDGPIELGFSRQQTKPLIGEKLSIPAQSLQRRKLFERHPETTSEEASSPHDLSSQEPERPSKPDRAQKKTKAGVDSNKKGRDATTKSYQLSKKDNYNHKLEDDLSQSSGFEPVSNNPSRKRPRNTKNNYDERLSPHSPPTKRQASRQTVTASPEVSNDSFGQLNTMIKDITNKANTKTRKRIEGAVEAGIDNIEHALDKAMEEEVAFVSKIHEKKMDALKNLHASVVEWANKIRDANRNHHSSLKRLGNDLHEITSIASETIEDIHKSQGDNTHLELQTQSTKKECQSVLDNLKVQIHKIAQEKDTSTIDAIKTMLALFQ